MKKSTGTDYMFNYVVTKRICERYDNKFETYTRQYYIKVLKSTQKNDSKGMDRFYLANSMAFYLK